MEYKINNFLKYMFTDNTNNNINKGTNIENCAIREVEEECGIKVSQQIEPFINTYHVYDEFGKHILKETHWYLMKADSNQNLIPQSEEEITGIEWVSVKSITEKMKNTYAQIKDIMSTFFS